eukprot:scaffold1736_cov127-Cylindrotheca_fusiformis.AAC.93
MIGTWAVQFGEDDFNTDLTWKILVADTSILASLTRPTNSRSCTKDAVGYETPTFIALPFLVSQTLV